MVGNILSPAVELAFASLRGFAKRNQGKCYYLFRSSARPAPTFHPEIYLWCMIPNWEGALRMNGSHYQRWYVVREVALLKPFPFARGQQEHNFDV